MSSELKTGPDVPSPATGGADPTTVRRLVAIQRADAEARSPASSRRRDGAQLGSVFWTSVGVSAVFVAWAVLFTDNLNKVTTASLNWVTATFGWTYLVVTLAILVFLVFLAFSPSATIRLGKDTDRPEFSTSPGSR